ncbi:nucleotidyltransferase domain-containing protein [Brumimicrobium oceani]|uniref:Nucleotidyltransferase domain-containing protein n=2 Tax=Brumimicrobium oceani TaxID=2100725 RepID=A0A2U2X0D4_9FLAO|nr:nucleotidyltransferase domain-containing protein [Brumimicrobium oceani]
METLAKNRNVERIIVFGSRARDDYEEFSDIDLAIDCPNMTKYDWLKLKEFVTYDLNIFIRISLVPYHLNPTELKERIITNGITIYEKGKTQ